MPSASQLRRQNEDKKKRDADFQARVAAPPAPVAAPPAPVAAPPPPVPSVTAVNPATGLSPIVTVGRATGKNMAEEVGLKTSAYSPAIADIMSRYQNSLAGFNSPQLAAQRAEQSQMINAQMLAAQRQNRAATASQGVRGAAALAGNQQIQANAMNARGAMENQLLAKQAEMQNMALGNYAGFMNNERGINLGAQFGMGNLAQTGAADDEYRKLLAEYVKSQADRVAAGGEDGSKPSAMDDYKNKWVSFHKRWEESTNPSWMPRNAITTPTTWFEG